MSPAFFIGASKPWVQHCFLWKRRRERLGMAKPKHDLNLANGPVWTRAPGSVAGARSMPIVPSTDWSLHQAFFGEASPSQTGRLSREFPRAPVLAAGAHSFARRWRKIVGLQTPHIDIDRLAPGRGAGVRAVRRAGLWRGRAGRCGLAEFGGPRRRGRCRRGRGGREAKGHNHQRNEREKVWFHQGSAACATVLNACAAFRGARRGEGAAPKKAMAETEGFEPSIGLYNPITV